jgi:hypothetical protein
VTELVQLVILIITIIFFGLNSSLENNAALLHLAFDHNVSNNTLWLLSSSITNKDALNIIIKVKFDSQLKNSESNYYTILPSSQNLTAKK